MTIYSDSQLVVRQITGVYGCHAEHLVPLCNECQGILKRFPKIKLIWIPREDNDVADVLTKQALAKAGIKIKAS